MTRLLVLSDLHLEHDPAWSMPATFPPFDVAVFAGDVDGSPELAVHRLATAPGLAGMPIVYVPGNHEFYHGHLIERLAAGKVACVGTSVHMLDGDSIVLAGVRFLGAILWTDYDLFGDADSAMDSCRRWLNDHRLVEVGPPRSRRLFQPEDALALHLKDRAFIEAELASPYAGPTVVVTHHGPHRGSVAKRYAHHPATAGFVSDLGDVIRLGRPELWIHGHVHDGFDYSVAATRIIANPKGYGPKRFGASMENAAFDPNLIIDLPGERDRYDDMNVAALQPTSTFEIENWTILRIRIDGQRHIVGYRTRTGRGRTSSPIRSFNRATNAAVTASGNRYVLFGDPSAAGLDDLLVLAWLTVQGLSRHEVETIGTEDL